MAAFVPTVLIVEDFAPDRELYRRCLLANSDHGYRFLEADSAAAALELCRTEGIDAILLDHILPDSDSFGFIEALQAQRQGDIPPVVVITGAGDETIAVRAMKLGVEDYLMKCRLTPEILQLAVRSAIENAQLRQQLKQSEAALQVANQQVTTIWESMSDAYATLDGEWRIVYANTAAINLIHQITGLKAEETLGRSHWEVFPEAVGQIVEQEYRRAVEEQVAVHFEFLYAPSGNWFEIHAYPSSVGLGIYFRDISDRKQAEEAIQQQLSEIESIYTMAPVGLCFVDTDLRFVRVNEQLAKIHNLPVSEHLGRTLREVLPNIADQLEPLYRQVLESGEPILNFELQSVDCMQPDQTCHWLVCYYPQKDTHQHVVGVNAMVQEITDRKRTEGERKQAEESLRESEQRFSAIFNQTFELIGMIGLDGILLDANQAALDSIGVQASDIVGKPFWEAPWWNHSQPLQEQLKEAIAQAATGQVIRYEVQFPGASGEPMTTDFSLKPVFDEVGQVVMLVGEGRDITDRKRNEQRLRESEERLNLGIQVAGVAIAKFDYASNTVALSPEAAALYGIPLDELIVTRDRIHDTFHPDERAELEKIIQHVVDPAGAGWFADEHRVVWQTGEVRWLSVRKQVFFDCSGEVPCPSYAILAAIDITDRKRAELERSQLLAETQAAREEAELANLSKDNFVAVVAHELRSPLNSVMGWAKLLQTRKLDDSMMKKALETIVRNTEAQVQLVEDLLDMSRMVRGTLQIQMAPVDWGSVIEAALDVVRPMAEAKQIQLEVELRATPQISGDFNRLQQIAVNLLTNAIKFTPERGQVSIYLERTETQAQLRICDTGKGIAADFLPVIFEQFQQGQQNTGAKDGLGLGLAIVKNLVELHSGTIAAESAGLEQGATFKVQLPVLSAIASTNDAQPMIFDITSLANIRILAVDDEPDMLELIAFVLRESGAEVQTAMSKAEALAQLPQFKPNLLVTDIAMAGGTGYDLLRQMRLEPEGNIPAIALTAYASATYEERSRQAGFERYLAKPVQPEALITAIAQLVNSIN